MDVSVACAYYLCIRHGVLPHIVEEMTDREQALVLAFAEKEKRDSERK